MEVSLGPYGLEVATTFGPRITGLAKEGGLQVLARLPDTVLEHPGGNYRFEGGHRLWVSPEIPEITYANDSHQCEVVTDGDQISIVAPPDAAGVSKRMSVTLDGKKLKVTNEMGRPGAGPALAPWAITQFPLGGIAFLPLGGKDETGAGANRYLVMWPYGSIDDSRVAMGDRCVQVTAAEGSPIKYGAGPDPGRLGYLREGMLFIKEIEPAGERDVPDFGAVGQVYIGQGFCELESVGGRTDLSAGNTATLVETWWVEECPDVDTALAMLLEARP
jgi:hypothetical protein